MFPRVKFSLDYDEHVIAKSSVHAPSQALLYVLC